MKSKKMNSAILAGFPCSHRKYIWFYNSGVSSLQISIVSSTEKLYYILRCQLSLFPYDEVIFFQLHSLIHKLVLTGLLQ